MRPRQSRKVEPESGLPSAERGKNSYHAAKVARSRSTHTGWNGSAVVEIVRSAWVAMSAQRSWSCARAWAFSGSAERISLANFFKASPSPPLPARLAADSMNPAPSKISLCNSRKPAANFFSNSCCHEKNTSPHASIVNSHAPASATRNSPAQRSFPKGRIGVSFQADSPTRCHFTRAATSSCPSLKISASTWIVPPTGRFTAKRALSSEGVMRRMTTVSGLLVMSVPPVFALADPAHQGPRRP